MTERKYWPAIAIILLFGYIFIIPIVSPYAKDFIDRNEYFQVYREKLTRYGDNDGNGVSAEEAQIFFNNFLSLNGLTSKNNKGTTYYFKNNKPLSYRELLLIIKNYAPSA